MHGIGENIHQEQSAFSTSLSDDVQTFSRRSSTDSLATNVTSSTLSNITTLELHPNVILGIPEDEGLLALERPHLCSICQASYKTRTHLRRHMFIHLSSRPFPCRECEKGFNRKEHLNKHLEAVHSGTKHRCPYCDKEISRLDHLKRHIKNMHVNVAKEDKYKSAAILKVQLSCGLKPKAQLSFLTPNFPSGTVGQTIITPIPLSAISSKTGAKVKEGSINVHSQLQILNKEQDEGSPSASMTIIPSNVLGHGEGVATLAIQSTPTQKVLVHQRLPTGSIVNLTTATNGLVGLANLSLALGHTPSTSLDTTDNKMLLQIFNCGDCTATFTTEKDLLTHSRTHKPQPYRCPNCPRAYTRREKLSEHIRCVHEGQKFRCEYCGKELSRKDHVLRHVRSVHPEVYSGNIVNLDDAEIRFDRGSLENCSSVSSTATYKNKSSRGSTINIPSLGDVGILLRSVCHVCLKVFGTAYHLTRHIESCHNGDVRPFSCAACNKMFKRKDHLTKHMKSHCPNMKERITVSDQLISNGGKFRLSKTDIEMKMELPLTENNADVIYSEGSVRSDCCRTIPPNIEGEVATQHSNDQPTHFKSSFSPSLHNKNSATGTCAIIPGEYQHKHQEQNEFGLAVIDSFMPGSVDVVVVGDAISSFLNQSSNSHPTTTFPCGQCQKQFTARDSLIDHLQEHANESVLQNEQHLSGLSFVDF